MKWHYLIPAAVTLSLLLAVSVGMLLRALDTAPPRVASTLGQVYRLEDGATQVDLVVYNTGRAVLEIGPQHTRLIDDAGQLWEVPPGETATIAPGASCPLRILGDLPEERRVIAVVVVADGAEEPVTLLVEEWHQRGEW